MARILEKRPDGLTAVELAAAVSEKEGRAVSLGEIDRAFDYDQKFPPGTILLERSGERIHFKKIG